MDRLTALAIDRDIWKRLVRMLESLRLDTACSGRKRKGTSAKWSFRRVLQFAMCSWVALWIRHELHRGGSLPGYRFRIQLSTGRRMKAGIFGFKKLINFFETLNWRDPDVTSLVSLWTSVISSYQASWPSTSSGYRSTRSFFSIQLVCGADTSLRTCPSPRTLSYRRINRVLSHLTRWYILGTCRRLRHIVELAVGPVRQILLKIRH